MFSHALLCFLSVFSRVLLYFLFPVQGAHVGHAKARVVKNGCGGNVLHVLGLDLRDDSIPFARVQAMQEVAEHLA